MTKITMPNDEGDWIEIRPETITQIERSQYIEIFTSLPIYLLKITFHIKPLFDMCIVPFENEEDRDERYYETLKLIIEHKEDEDASKTD